VVRHSPVRKFADTPEGVGHRHKLIKLVEENNNLIDVIRGKTAMDRLFMCRPDDFASFGTNFSSFCNEIHNTF